MQLFLDSPPMQKGKWVQKNCEKKGEGNEVPRTELKSRVEIESQSI